SVLELDPAIRELLVSLGLDPGHVELAIVNAAGPPLPLDAPLDLSATPGHSDSLRIIDASANRAREALRVLEDFARFVLNDDLLTRELKELRHDLAELLGPLPLGALMASRDTEHDVGTAITTEQEQHRESIGDVATAAWKRLQESLRSLEEYGKLY